MSLYWQFINIIWFDICFLSFDLISNRILQQAYENQMFVGTNAVLRIFKNIQIFVFTIIKIYIIIIKITEYDINMVEICITYSEVFLFQINNSVANKIGQFPIFREFRYLKLA